MMLCLVFESQIFLQDIQPLRTFHFGGDEVPRDALLKSPLCRQLLVDHPDLKQAHGLKRFFTRRIVSSIARRGLDVQAWEEGLGADGHAAPPNLTYWESGGKRLIINAWNAGKRAPFTFADAGYQVVLSQAHMLYIDHPYEPDFEEPGLFWATRATTTRKIYRFLLPLEESATNASFMFRHICNVYGMPNCTELMQPQNVIGKWT
jgi:hexosaminidase